MSAAGLRSFMKGPCLALRAALLGPLRLLEPESRLLPGAVKNILVIRKDRLGDLILSLPFLKNLRTAFPGAEITLLAQSFAGQIVSDEVDRIISPDEPALAKKLKAQRFALAIDMHYDYTLSTALLCRASGARWRAGFDIAGRGFLFNIRVPAEEKKHFIAETADILTSLGINPELGAPSVSVRGGDKEAAIALLKEKGLSRETLVAVHPGGFYKEQRWPPQRFTELLNRLHESKKFSFLLLGGPQDAELLGEISTGLRGPHLNAGGLELRLSAALTAQASLFIGNNSGPLHLACALGLPTVSTMGPTDPVRWNPVGARNTVVRKPVVEDITVAEMEQAALRLTGA